MASQRELVKELFGAALDVKPAERAAFLDMACCGDTELKREVENLLDADINAGSFLEPTNDLLNALRHPSETVIGPYHLLELIGEGGVGEVWLAEQRQPVRRRVAIKLIKAGMDTREVVARFESERQALALMDHHAIAKVFDAGSTPGGRPYFVMEYVVGVPITAYCDRHKLTVRQRMELFVQVCEGVQHAHQRAIIHRDLKPSNILVSEVDGKAMPRIIDFGVAKAISQKLTTQTIYTRVGMLIGTLGYMSPEQADSVGEHIDTRTDVYSLGVVFYELLVGALPLDLRNLAYDEVLHRLRELDPPRPSVKLRTMGAASAIAAKNRSSDPSRLSRQLRGDPDAIALKALERDRARRYASASELTSDIVRHLRNEPVTAHLHSTAYGGCKYIGRHRLAVATAAIVVLLLALLVTWWRLLPAVPAVESARQLTDDGQPKFAIVSDGSRIYFNTGRTGALRIAQVPVTGGPTVPVQTRFATAYISGITHDGSALLVLVPPNCTAEGQYRDSLWLVPLPAGEPRRLGSLVAENANILPDGRIVFGKSILETDAKRTDNRTNWFIADKNGSNPRKFVSFPGPVGAVSVSPDGKRILLSQEQVGDRRLFDIAPDGTGLREVRQLSGDDNFIWGSNGKYLLGQSGDALQSPLSLQAWRRLAWKSDIWLLPMQTGFFRRPGKPVRLTNGPLPYGFAYPSRDGKQIFALVTKQRGELVRYDIKSKLFQQLLSGVSGTDPTFSRDGKWVAYASYPDRRLWRSRGDGTDPKQLTFPPMSVYFPFISPDGTRVSFFSDTGDLFVVSMEGGTPQRVDETGTYATWSPDGNSLYYQIDFSGGGGRILDLRTGKKLTVPSSANMYGFWLTQDVLIARNIRQLNFQTFDLKTQKWTDFAMGGFARLVGNWMLSPDRKYVYFTLEGTEPKVLRLRFADNKVDTITSLKDFDRVPNVGGTTQINVASDGSPVFTRDTGYQEIYALNVRWP